MTSPGAPATGAQRTQRTVAIVCGGQSAEHEVSVRSARSILRAIDRATYRPVIIAIDRGGRWGLVSEESLGRGPTEMIGFDSHAAGTPLVAVVPRDPKPFRTLAASGATPFEVDVVFPVLHGPMGEDGTMQGFFRIAGVPFVGSGVLGSAACMDKEVAKRLLSQAGILTPEFVAIRRHESEAADLGAVVRRLGFPCFVKPASLGSSIGISKVSRAEELRPAMQLAFAYDDKVLVERGIVGREIECSVLGNEEPEASLAGEIVAPSGFYSFDAKYVDGGAAELRVPAELPPSVMAEVRRTAVRAYRALECSGMARVDFFVEEGGRVLVNEINTLPGFTSISMYPKLWEATGLAHAELIDRLITLAVRKFERDEAHVRLK